MIFKCYVDVVNKYIVKGIYFFDYGNVFLLEVLCVGGDVMVDNSIDFKYLLYV